MAASLAASWISVAFAAMLGAGSLESPAPANASLVAGDCSGDAPLDFECTFACSVGDDITADGSAVFPLHLQVTAECGGTVVSCFSSALTVSTCPETEGPTTNSDGLGTCQGHGVGHFSCSSA